MASVKSAFEAYAAEALPDASPETVEAAREAFFAGALVVLRQVEDPGRSIQQQRHRLRRLAGEINDYSRDMALREAKKGANG